MPETTPSPLPTTQFAIANLAVKVNTEASNQEEGGKGAGRLMAVLLLICYVVAVSLPFSSCKIPWAGNALYHKCIHHLEQWGLTFGSSL